MTSLFFRGSFNTSTKLISNFDYYEKYTNTKFVILLSKSLPRFKKLIFYTIELSPLYIVTSKTLEAIISEMFNFKS